MSTVIGLDLGHADVWDAEHWLRDRVAVLGGPGVVACTHLVRGERPRVAMSLSGVDPLHLDAEDPIDDAEDPIDPAVASAVAVEHHARRSGRAVVYPGVDALLGPVCVGDVLTRSAIERVSVLGGPPPGIDIIIDTRDFVRPEWKNGLLTLVTAPAPAGRIAPFEYPNPHPCCGGH
jgi:hypothetical protein